MKNKDVMSKLKKGYVKVPIEVFHVGLPLPAFGIYVMMVSCSEEFQPSIRYLAKKLKISKDTVSKYINLLIELNLITKTYEGNLNISNEYKFNPPSSWLV